MMNMKDKVIVITGGTSGIGKITGQEFAKLGAKVIALTVDKDEVCQEAIKEIGNNAKYIKCDVSNDEQVKNAIESIVNEYGKIDYAFNNAGVGPDGVRMPYQSLTETDEKTWDFICDVNMKGVYLCMKYELLQMQKQGHGSIVNTASIGGYRMAPNFSAYGPSKAGVIALTEVGAIENAAYGIRVNCICPGPTDGTELTNNTIASDPKQKEIFLEHVIPMKKLAQPTDIANAVIWLCSDLSGHTTGQKIFVDGGMSVA